MINPLQEEADGPTSQKVLKVGEFYSTFYSTFIFFGHFLCHFSPFSLVDNTDLESFEGKKRTIGHSVLFSFFLPRSQYVCPGVKDNMNGSF